MSFETTISSIETELKWRETELSLAKINLHRAIGDPTGFKFAYRCFISMTYAHFEGFTKRILAQAFSDIRGSVGDLVLLNLHIKEELLAPILRKEFDKKSNAELLKITLNGATYINSISLPSPEKLFSTSNLNFENFACLIRSVGLSPDQFLGYKASINRLKTMRHECAHGDEIAFDSTKKINDLAKDAFLLQFKIIELMHYISIQVIDSIEKEEYLAAPPPRPGA